MTPVHHARNNEPIDIAENFVENLRSNQPARAIRCGIPQVKYHQDSAGFSFLRNHLPANHANYTNYRMISQRIGVVDQESIRVIRVIRGSSTRTQSQS